MDTRIVSELSIMSGPPLDLTVGDRIDDVVRCHAEEHPDAVAVRWADQDLTYRQLVERAERFAAALTRTGVRPGDVVAAQLGRSPDLACLLLAILQLGAIYTLMPLDWPVARRREVLDLTNARVCVSGDADAFQAAQPMVSLERLLRADPHDLVGIAVRGKPQPPDSGHLGDLSGGCCIFFTSGSSGTPKCTVAPHRGVIRVAKDPEVPFGPSTVMLQSASMAWDLFAFELWAPLLNGGTALMRSSEYFSYQDLRDAVAEGANTAFLTPTIFNGAVTDDLESLRGLRTIFIGGDRASAKPVETFLARYPGSTVINLYGPVEATIWVTRHHMESVDDFGTEVPIGSPGARTQIYLLDDDRRVVPIGEIGEIAAAGDGLALGYLGNPEETERRFKVLPIGPDGTDIRVYFTGDFGRIDERGLLQFHGRRDRQVKILGLRVEPHEVERVIGELPGVSAVVAMPVPIGSQQPDGIAVVYSTGQSATPDPDEVRRAVAAALPRAFVPRVIRRLDELPLNANKKLDQRRIVALVEEVAGGRGEAGSTLEQRVRTPLMTLLVELEALTGVAPSVDSDVIDLGLTSITALKLISRVRAVHGIGVPMNVLFRSRTPAAIAEWIEAQ
jgi:amino acid adenylation domain-containing protein